MKEISSDPNLIAYCGLYCGACKKYLLEKCPGCHENEKASWCKIRSCNIGHGYRSCADCTEFNDVRECKHFNNFIARFFALVFSSDRPACIDKIREMGTTDYATFMAEHKLQTIKR